MHGGDDQNYVQVSLILRKFFHKKDYGTFVSSRPFDQTAKKNREKSI